MKTNTLLIFLVFMCGTVLAGPLEDDLAAAGRFTDGQSADPLKRIEEQAVEALADPALRAELEPKLLAALEAASTRRGIDFLCRMLRIAGTGASIPAMEKLLHKPEHSHMARYVLESMATENAAKALHRSLAGAPGELRGGIIDSLGALGYAPAAGEIATALPDENAVRALGRIGGKEATTFLLIHLDRAKPEMRPLANQSLLRCAEHALAEGRLEDAYSVYAHFLENGESNHENLAGLAGLVKVRREKAVPVLLEMMKNEDPQLANGAAALIAEIEGEGVGAQLQTLLESAPPAMQELLIGSLAERGERSAAPGIAALAKSDNAGVRITAIEALGRVGGADLVPLLAGIAAATSGHERNVARGALATLEGEGISAAIGAALQEAAPEVQAELVRALATRAEPDMAKMLLWLAKAPRPEVRSEALRGLRGLAGPEHLPALLTLLNDPADPGDLGAIESAIAAALRELDSDEQQVAALAKAYGGARPPARRVLIALLGRVPSSSSLEILRRALAGPAELQRAAIGALSQWPNAEPADDLMKIAKKADGDNAARALDAYIALAPHTGDVTSAYIEALKVSDNDGVARKVLAGIAEHGDVRSILLVQTLLQRRATANEATIAATKVAGRIRNDQPAAAKALLDDALASAAGDGPKREARKLRDQIK